ncbi:hypothetical protein ACFWY9_43920 [Amycolatopsis sp. NPDC059027]|uniref:hypothetical protein n=1 Tax=unclassified Amycolatopsis TaxID=2618356 RepID=UPI00366E0BAB
MGDEDEDGYDVADLGLIRSIALPADGKIPVAVAEVPSREHYDGYFRIARGRPDLAAWTQSCLDVQRDVLADLAHSSLSDEDKAAILAGCVVVLHSTLAEWLAPAGIEEAAA